MKHDRIMRWIIRSCMLAIIFFGICLFLYYPRLLKNWYRDKSITILVWPTVLDAEYVTAFEQETGIKVYVSYFEHNEELLVKLQATQGHGYDLIMPSDYMAELMIKKKLLKKIDHAQLNFFKHLYPALQNHYYDPHNEYTIPFFWSVYGLGINTNYFGGVSPPATWGLVFDKAIAPNHVGMIDDARDLVLIAAQYLFGTIDDLTDNQLQHITHMLHAQKQWVTMYTDMRTRYLLASGTVPVSIMLSADMIKIMHNHPEFDFIIPQEGSFAVIDSFAIPIGSTKEQYVYQFLNYIYDPTLLQHYVDKYGFFPATDQVKSPDVLPHLAIPSMQLFSPLDFFRNVIDAHSLNDIWIDLKS
jgi:spermidine/putrescine transport system substrate-binding protein